MTTRLNRDVRQSATMAKMNADGGQAQAMADQGEDDSDDDIFPDAGD